MAEYDIEMQKRNTTNTDWDKLYPITKAANVVAADGTTFETHKADNTTAHGIINKIDKSLLTAAGDIIYASATNTPAKLSKGTEGQALVLSGGLPRWGNVSDGSWRKISEQILATDTVQVDFTSIPSSYKLLKLFVLTQNSIASNGSLFLNVNDIGANFIYSTDTTNSSSSFTSSIQLANLLTNGRFSMAEMTISSVAGLDNIFNIRVCGNDASTVYNHNISGIQIGAVSINKLSIKGDTSNKMKAGTVIKLWGCE